MVCAIEVDGVSKMYRIRHAMSRGGDHSATFRETLAGLALSPFRSWRKTGDAGRMEDFWALRDISFQVDHGEVLGLVGSNGAGKSTLLKILTRITGPTSGSVRMRGRVGSLLEVGTGFHPELTGRENVFLNGAIHGLTREQVRRRFDEILDFSGVEKFIDVPIKRYSSGMKVRLAFSVAAILEPDILVIDEVLAVGDADFRSKCLDRMHEAARSGRTVLFVSHNMGAVRKLCSRVLLLRNGRLELDGEPDDVLETYVGESLPPLVGATADLSAWHRQHDRHGSQLRFQHAQVLNSQGRPTDRLRFGEPFTIEVHGTCREQIDRAAAVVGIDSNDSVRIASATSEDAGIFYSGGPGDRIDARVTFQSLPLAPGRYSITLGMRLDRHVFDRVANCLAFEVGHTPHDGFVLTARMHGHLRPMERWNEPGILRASA